MHPKCREEVSKILGRDVTASEAINLQRRINAGMRAIATQDPNAWRAMSQAEQLREGARYAAQQLIGIAQKRKQRADLAIQADQRLKSQIDRMVSAGVAKDKLAALSRLMAPLGDGKSGVTSLDETVNGIKTVYGGIVAPALELTKGKAFGFVRDPQAEANLVRAMWRDPGAPKEFAEGAEQIHSVFTQLKERMNRSGGMIGTLENYDMPHSWSPTLIAGAAGKEGDPRKVFADKMLPRMKRSVYRHEDGRLFSDQEMHKFLYDAATSIMTDGANKRLDEGKTTLAKPGGGVKANRNSKERQIHLSDADAYLAAMKDFSDTPVQAAIYNHIDRMARDIGLIEVFGPNADVTVSHLVNRFHDEKVVDNVGKEVPKVEAAFQARSIANLYNQIAGNNPGIPQTKASQFFGAYRNLKYSATLGGTSLLAAPTDSAVSHLVIRGMGLSNAKLFQQQLKTFAHNDSAIRDGARRAGIAWQAFGEGMARWGGEVGDPGITSKIAETVIRATGLNYVTEANRNAFAATMFDGIGHLTQKYPLLDGIKEGDGRFISRSGLTQRDWDLMRIADVEDWGSGDRILTPQAIMALPESEVARIIGTDDANQIIKAKEDASTRYAGFIHREMNSAIITPGAREKAATEALANRAGSGGGVMYEVVKSFLMFKSFAFAAFNKLIMRTGAFEGKGAKVKYLTSMMALTTIGGAAGITLRGLASGKDPDQMFPGEDLQDSKEAYKFYVRAVLAGGGLGFYGDLLTEAIKDPYSGLAGQLLGPFYGDIQTSAGVLSDTAKLAGSAVDSSMSPEERATKVATGATRFAKSLTPGSNLWYTKAATDHLIFNQIQEAIAPGSLARGQGRAARDGTSYWWSPTEALPSRAPDFGSIMPAR